MTVEILLVDVSNLPKLTAELGRMDRFSGVIHAAGVVNDAKLEDMDWRNFIEVLYPKVHGTYHLHQLTASSSELSIFTMFSSCNAILGSRKQSNYLAANSFMDAMAFHRQSQNLCGQSVAWSAWEVGMASGLDAPFGMHKISVQEGIQAFSRVCQGRLPWCHIMVAKVDWRMYRKAKAYGETCGCASSLQGLVVNLAEANTVPCKADAGSMKLTQKVQAILWEHFEVTETDEEIGFSDLGLDSLHLQELAQCVTEETGISIGVMDLFDYSSVAKLVGFLQKTVLSSDTLALPQLQALPAKPAKHALDILGVACRYPGRVTTPAELWQILASARDCVGTVPSDRWDPEFMDEIYSDCISSLEGLDLFDAPFFNIAPASAKFMDPQLRLSFECVYHAREDAGLVGPDVEDTTAVLAGYMTSDFFQIYGHCGDVSVPAGTMQGIFPGHISNFFDLKGPSLSCLSACSSSLVALDMSKKQIESGSCNRAVALGANVILSADLMIQACKMGMLSKKGRCRSFDQEADGYVRGEGCGVIILGQSRASDATHGALSGSASGHDGRSTAVTHPNAVAQARVIKLALSQSAINAEEVKYVEAHGTGTELGDPLEIRGLRKVFEGLPSPLLVGTAKSTFGHLEAAAGILGVHRTLCCLKYSTIPKHIWLKTLSKRVLEEMGDKPWCHIVAEKTPWASGEASKIAGVSSFGLSGTNAHILLQGVQEPERQVGKGKAQPCILFLSAKTQQSLEKLKMEYVHCLSEPCDAWTICLAAASGRAHFHYRFAASGEPFGLVQALRTCSSFGKLQKSQPIVHLELEAADGMEVRGQDLYDQSPFFQALKHLFAEYLSAVVIPLALASLLETWGLRVELSGNLPIEHLSQLHSFVEGFSLDDIIHHRFTGLKSKIAGVQWAGGEVRVGGFKVKGQSEASVLGERCLHSTVSEMLAQLYLGWEETLDWRCFSASFGRTQHVGLLLYPFDRRSYMPQPSMASEFVLKDPSGTLWFTSKLQVHGAWRFLLDHRLEGQSILPAAAHLEILLEVVQKAMKHLGRDKICPPIGLQDVRFLTPLALEQKTYKLVVSFVESGSSVELKVFEESMSKILCQARVARSRDDFHHDQVARQELESWKTGKTLEAIEAEQIYRDFNAMGLDYGKAFRALRRAEILNGDVRAEIHAESLTALFDGALQALGLGLGHIESPVPTDIGEIRLYNESILSTTTIYASWSPRPTIKCVDSCGQVVAVLKDIQVTSLQKQRGKRSQLKPFPTLSPPTAPAFEDVFFHEDWAPDNCCLVLTIHEQRALTDRMVQEARTATVLFDAKKEEERNEQLNALARAYMVEILRPDGLKQCEHEHHSKLATRFRRVLQRAGRHDSLAKDFCSGSVGGVAAKIQSRSSVIDMCPELALLQKCGEALFRGEMPARDIEALSLLSPEKDQLYSDGISCKAANDFIAECVSALQGVAPARTSVLEIGAGSGATAKAIFKHLDSRFPPGNYWFTDISEAFFRSAKETLAVSTARLDIEKDPLQQGFVPESFNIVVCTNVLHATEDLRATLQHIRGLCAPGALMVLSETVVDDEWLDLTFGLLSG